MRNNFKNKVISLFKWIIGNIIWQLLVLIISNASYIYILAKYFNKLSILDIILLTVLLITVIIFFILTLWKKTSFKSYYYPRKTIKPDYYILHKNVYYEIDENTQTTYCKQILTFKVTCDKLNYLESHFLWTGSDTPNLPHKCPGDQLISDITPVNFQQAQERYPGVWIPYHINFFNPLKKGTVKTISYEWRFSSLQKKSFLSISTYEPTKKITVELTGNSTYFLNNSFRVSEKRSPIMEYHIKNFCIIDNKKDKNGATILQDMPESNESNNIVLNEENDKMKIKVTLEKVKRFRTYVFDWSSKLD